MATINQISLFTYIKYTAKQKINILYYFAKIKKIKIDTDTFNFYNAVSTMASSKIEGELLEIDSYVKHKTLNVKYIKALTEKPNDLFNAYEFAQKNTLTKANFLKAHKLVSKNLLHTFWRGKVRNADMVVRTNNKIVYEACAKETVQTEFDNFFVQVADLIKKDLSLKETFFYASLMHLIFVNIHPFDDANGRMGRLLEKWFLATKLGQNAWFVQSELYYWNNQKDFYKNLNKTGFSYQNLDYAKAIDFLLMLPKSLK